jgi:molecular chaperone GrpE
MSRRDRQVMSETDQLRRPARDRMDAPDAGGANQDPAGKTDRLRRALAEEQQQNLRLRADLENLRRRTAKEQESAQRGGRRAALIPVLPVLDALERALATRSSDPSFYEGVAATFRLFTDALTEAGAHPFDSVGQPFDPAIHEAVGIVHTGDIKSGTVMTQVLRGWRLNGELLRPARVIVASNADDAT